jgi:hypothetical protein
MKEKIRRARLEVKSELELIGGATRKLGAAKLAHIKTRLLLSLLRALFSISQIFLFPSRLLPS